MNIQLEELRTADKQIFVTAYLAMLQPMMQRCGSDKQNIQYNLIYRTLSSGREINREDLLNMLEKITELASTEDEMINHYRRKIIKIVALGVNVIADQSESAFDLLIEELTQLIALLNDAIVSLEDIIGENLSIIKKLEERQEKIGKYIQIEMIKGEETDKQGKPKTYAIHSDLDKLFEAATESIVKILSERGMVNKQAYIDQVVYGVQRVLKIPIEVISRQKRKEYVNVSDEMEEVAASMQVEESTLPDQLQATADGPAKLEEGSICLEETLKEMNKETFLNTVKNLAEGPADIAHVQEPMYYELLCKQQMQYKFTKAQQKQLTSWLDQVKKVLNRQS